MFQPVRIVFCAFCIVAPLQTHNHVQAKTEQGKEVDLDLEDPQSQGEDLDFYSFFAVDAFDDIIAFEKYRGKVSLIVNVASYCGYTDGHYKGLQLLQKMFRSTGLFTVLAFPCNQFGAQEPGTIQDIRDFVYDKMGSTFPLFSKVDVIGNNALPAWKFLSEKSGYEPTWNFWKYLINHHGEIIGAWSPSVNPENLYQKIQEAIDAIEPEKNRVNVKEEF